MTDEYININNQINSLNKKNSELIDENNNLKTDINTIQDKLDNTLNENERLKSRIVDVEKSSNNFDQNKNEDIEYTETLNNIYIIDSVYYELIKGFTDSYGNSYSLAYKFDASNNSYDIFNLNKQYNKFAGYITASQETGRGANMTVEIYGDDILLKKFENITKISEAIPLEDIEVNGVKKLTINTYNTGEYPYGYVYLTDIKLK